MDGDELQRVSDASADALPGVSVEQRFAPDWDIYKVGGKVFMLITPMPGRPVVILKADPDHAAALREQHAGITAGYHMNKRHWITLEGDPTLTAPLVQELVRTSYGLVTNKLPESQRP